MRLIRVVSLLLLQLTLASVTASVAATVKTRLTCPRTVEAGASARLDLHLENQVCSARSLRILSTVVGNGDNTTGGVAILGPKIAAQSVPVPAATDLLSGVCSAGWCVGSFDSCATNSDCLCRSITPGVADVELVVPTPSIGIEGSVLKQFIFTDGMDGSPTVSDSCLIAVPEPKIAMQYAAALVVLAFLSRWANPALNQKENES